MYSFYDETLLRLGLPLEQTTLPQIVFYFNAGIAVEGHKGVLSFSDREIVFRVGRDKVKITGKELTVREISDRQLFIRGEIESVGVCDEK